MASSDPDIKNNNFFFEFICNNPNPIELLMKVIDSNKNIIQPFPIETLLSELNINTNNLKNRFFWDIIKDANAGKNKISNIQTILQQCFSKSNTETGWQVGLHNLDTDIFNFVKNSGQIDDPYIDCKTSTEGQQNIKLSNADYVFYESGMGSDKLVHDNPKKIGYPIKIGSSAATLDPASKQEIDKLFNYNLGFDSSFTSSLGFPPNITWVTKDLLTGTGSAPAPNTLCSSKVFINFGTLPNKDETINISDTVQNKCGIMVTDSNQGNFAELCLGNNEKNKKINTSQNLNYVKKLLVMKELGDIAQIWVYLAFVTILKNVGIPPLSPGPSETARTDSIMLTTDNPVFLFCIMLKLACINSGSRQGVTSGGCRLKYYYPGEPQFKKKYENVQNIYYESTIQYNNNINALILRIITKDICKDVDIYILVRGKRGRPDGDMGVEPKCIPGAEEASNVHHARNEMKKGLMVVESVKTNAEKKNTLVDFIIDYNDKISENNNRLKIISKFFEWNGIVRTDPLFNNAKDMSDMLKMMMYIKGFSNEVEHKWMQKLTTLFDNNLNDKKIFESLLNGQGVYNYICTRLGITNIIFNKDGILDPKVDNYESLKTNIQKLIDTINNLYHKITIGLKTEKCIMQHIKIKNDQSKTMRNIILPGNFFNSLKEIAFPDPSNKFKNFVRFAEVDDIIKGAMTNNINFDDQGKPITEEGEQILEQNFGVQSSITGPSAPMSIEYENQGGGNRGSGKDPDGYQPYYTSLLLTYTDYQIKNHLSEENPSIFPFESLQDMSFETIAMRMCGDKCGRMIINEGRLMPTTEEQKKLYFEALQNLQLMFALKYEENAEMINFQKPGFKKLLVGKEEMIAEEGTTNDLEMVDLVDINNFYKVENSLKSLKNFAYVYDDTFIFNQGKRLAQYIAFAGETELINKVGMKRSMDLAVNTDATNALYEGTNRKYRTIPRSVKSKIQGVDKASYLVSVNPDGGKRKTKKRLRNNKKTKKTLRRKLIKGKKSLKRKKLLKQRKSLKVKKLNKLKKTKKK